VAADLRLAVVVRPLDRVLTATRVILIPFLVVAACWPAVNGVAASIGGSKSLVVSVAGLAIGILSMLVLQSQAIGKRVDLTLARATRRIAMACNHNDGAAHDRNHLACWLTPQMLRAPLFRYEAQYSAVAALTHACSEEASGHYWFVEGGSGTGKTRTALLLVQTLVRDLKLCDVGCRCYFYDCADSAAVQRQLKRRLGTAQHEGAVVLVDNFQLVSRDVLHTLTHRLLDSPDKICERLIVFLARPGDAWNLSPGSDVRLASKAREADRYLRLTGPPSDWVARCVSEFDPIASQLVRDLQEDDVASAAQLHIAQVIARNRAVSPEILAALRVLGGDTTSPPSKRLIEVLAVASALSMHRGTFSPRDVWRGVLTAGRALAPRAPLGEALRLRARFRRLCKLGLIPRLRLDDTRYVFHEAIAELFIDRLWHVPAFQLPFTAVGKVELQRAQSKDTDLAAWYTATEIGDQQLMEARFDAAAAHGAYPGMARCLSRADARYELEGSARLQRAILLDRIGEFAASRAEFADLADRLESLGELAVIFAAGRIEANHDEDSYAALAGLCNHPDRIVAIIGDYWTLHIAAHHGSFNSKRLLELATEALELVRHRDSHWLTYSLARMQFDSLRHHYLAGETPARVIASQPRRRINDHLRDRLPTYEPLHTLYTQAYLVGHVLLPRVAIYNEPVTSQDAALADVPLEDIATLPALLSIVQRLYVRARNEFWQYGDREAGYLEAEVLNAEMIQTGADLDGLIGRLHEYRRFIRATGFADLASYPHFYFVRWHLLMYYALLLDTDAHDTRTVDEHLTEARRHLRSIVELDTAVRNDYGVLRAEFIGLLIDAMLDPVDQEHVSDLRGRMLARGYGIETTLLTHLSERGALTAAELRTIIRFYPFVHQ
jgi:hypothetical protein